MWFIFVVLWKNHQKMKCQVMGVIKIINRLFLTFHSWRVTWMLTWRICRASTSSPTRTSPPRTSKRTRTSSSNLRQLKTWQSSCKFPILIPVSVYSSVPLTPRFFVQSLDNPFTGHFGRKSRKCQFHHILRSHFAPIFLCPKLQSWNVTKKRCMKHFCTKKRQDLNDSLYNLVGRLTGLNCIFSNSPLYSFFFSIPLQSRKVL